MVIIAIEIKQLENGGFEIIYSIVPSDESKSELGVANMICDVTKVVFDDGGKSAAVDEILRRAALLRASSEKLM